MKYFDVYRDVWNFHKQFLEITDTDDVWSRVLSEAHKIEERYDGDKFVVGLLFTIIEEMERRCKQSFIEST